MPRPRTGSVRWNKARKYWEARLDWTDENGKEHCRKRRVESKTEGNQVVKQWIHDLRQQGSDYISADRMTFRELAARYEKERLIPPVYREGTKVMGLRSWKGQRLRLARLVQYFGSKRIQAITVTDIERFRSDQLQTLTERRQRPRSIADVNRGLALLRSVLTFAFKSGWLIRNPFSMATGIISIAQEVARDRVLSTEEQRRLLHSCQRPWRRHIYPLVLTALDSGCRRGELIKLCWRDVDMNKGLLTVTAENSKTNKPRVIDLESITVDELRKLKQISGGMPDERCFGIKHNFAVAFNSAMKDAGIEGARFHDLRATAITTWLLRGLTAEFAMRRSGHSEPKTFQRYVRICDEIRQKQRAQMGEWELGVSLTALASEPLPEMEIEPERPEMIN